jgi:hypothetical protein
MGNECFIYGSQHDIAPDRCVIMWILDRVDYVLLEEFYMNWRRLFKEKPWKTLQVLILGIPTIALLYLYVLCIRISRAIRNRLYYRRYGLNFISDTRYVRSLADLISKQWMSYPKTDEDIVSIYEKRKSIFIIPSISFIAIIIALSLVMLYGIPHIPNYLKLIKLNLIPNYLKIILEIILNYLKLILEIILVVISIFFILIIARSMFRKVHDLRDGKLIETANKLLREGYSILIVRGKDHVKRIKERLEGNGVGLRCIEVPSLFTYEDQPLSKALLQALLLKVSQPSFIVIIIAVITIIVVSALLTHYEIAGPVIGSALTLFAIGLSDLIKYYSSTTRLDYELYAQRLGNDSIVIYAVIKNRKSNVRVEGARAFATFYKVFMKSMDSSLMLEKSEVVTENLPWELPERVRELRHKPSPEVVCPDEGSILLKNTIFIARVYKTVQGTYLVYPIAGCGSPTLGYEILEWIELRESIHLDGESTVCARVEVMVDGSNVRESLRFNIHLTKGVLNKVFDLVSKEASGIINVSKILGDMI